MKKIIILTILIACFFTNIANAKVLSVPKHEILKNTQQKNEKNINAIFENYLTNVRAQIRNHWHPKESQDTYRIVVRFILDKEGNLVTYKIIKGTDNKETNQIAINAIKNAAPFGKFPSGYNKERIMIQYTFDYEEILNNIYAQKDNKITTKPIKTIIFNKKEYKLSFARYNKTQKYKRAQYIPVDQTTQNYLELILFNKMPQQIETVYDHSLKMIERIETCKKLYTDKDSGIIYLGYQYETIGFKEKRIYDTYCFAKLVQTSPNQMQSMEYRILIPKDMNINRRKIISEYKRLVKEYEIPNFVNRNYGKTPQGMEGNRLLKYK